MQHHLNAYHSTIHIDQANTILVQVHLVGILIQNCLNTHHCYHDHHIDQVQVHLVGIKLNTAIMLDHLHDQSY